MSLSSQFKIIRDHFISLTLSIFHSLFSFCRFYHGVDGSNCRCCPVPSPLLLLMGSTVVQGLALTLHSKKVQLDLSVRSLHALPVYTWVFHRFSDFVRFLLFVQQHVISVSTGSCIYISALFCIVYSGVPPECTHTRLLGGEQSSCLFHTLFKKYTA